ncbi:MAG: hypothetical protein OEY33_02620 [Bdellovibrionales bacterium]|jgi:hypothetical protein|nr:hypothetical protein [Bdellovibrionales bacterium]
MVSQDIFSRILLYSSENLVPFMLILFLGAIFFRFGAYITVKLLNEFVNHFEINTMDTVTGKKRKTGHDFYETVKDVLWQSFEEHFVYKSKFKRRKLDRLTSFSDRILLIKEGSRRMIDDTLNHAKYCSDSKNKPDFNEIVTYLIKSNPVFKKVYGVLPLETISEVLSVLPNIFVVLGIFGTFIGIMLALPELQGMDLSNLEATKKTMDEFLLKIAFSMNTSILGIILSIGLNIMNSFFSSDVILDNIRDTFRNSLGLLWNESHSVHSRARKSKEKTKAKAS